MGIFQAEWKRLANKGQKIAAIKAYRNAELSKGKPLPDLSATLILVDSYMARKVKK